jgi:cell division protein FtsW
MIKTKNEMKSFDFVLFSTILLLVAIGIVMVYSASSYAALYNTKIHDDMFYLKKQALWVVIGTFLMFLTVKYDYHKLKGGKTILLIIVTTGLLIVVMFFSQIKGASRWITLGFASVQPSEIAKYIVVLYMAQSIEYKGERIKDLVFGVLPYLLFSGMYAGLVLAEKSLSIAAVIMIVTIIVLFVAGAKIWHLICLVIPAIFAAGAIAILKESYRLTRLMNFINPWADAKGAGYQLIQSLLALGSGGVWGLGIGMSRQKRFYIPEPHTDFIFSIIGEELGLIGCIGIIVLFLIFIWRGVRIAIKAKDTYGTLLATGITSVIAVQAIINIAVVSGMFPVTGVPLPFISYGGSSLVLNLLACGVLLNISRQIDESNK